MNCKIYVVVPVFNRKPYIERFLYCMREQTFKNFEVIVTDDGSTDGTSEMIAENFKEVQLIQGDGNLWWTGAVNEAIRHALSQASEADAILVINDDLEVDPNYLDILHTLFKSMPKTLIGSVVVDLHNPDVIHDGGVRLNMLTAKYRVLNRNQRLGSFGNNYYTEVSLLTGRGTLIPVPVFIKIGLYDDKHFKQCGDIEFPVRAKNTGYRLIVSYNAIVKSYVDSTDNMNITNCYNLKDLKKYFFDIKSNFRLKYHFFFSLKTAKNPLYFISFFLCDLLRISWHFLIRLHFKQVNKNDA